jgi:hypothetical protein
MGCVSTSGSLFRHSVHINNINRRIFLLLLFTHDIHILFQFLLHLKTFRCFSKNYSNLMLNMEHLYMNEPIRDPPGISFNFLPKKCLIMMINNKKLF